MIETAGGTGEDGRSQKGVGIVGGSCHKYNFCRGEHMFVATNMCLSRQFTSFVATKVCLSRQNFRRDTIVFVGTNICRDKHVALSRQNFACRYKHKIMFVATNICRDKKFLATKIFHNFVKVIMLVATKDVFLQNVSIYSPAENLYQTGLRKAR